jgi:hypothetical protein
MRTRVALGVVAIGFAASVRPPSAESFICGGTVSSSTAFSGADLVLGRPGDWPRRTRTREIRSVPGRMSDRNRVLVDIQTDEER